MAAPPPGVTIVGTLPPPHLRSACSTVASHPLLAAVRFNIGARSALSPRETLERLLEQVAGTRKELWVDLKGRQLRIEQWAVPTFGDIILNHEFTVDLPARIVYRAGKSSSIEAVVGNKVFVNPPPSEAVGAGQAVNVHGTNLHIQGFLTREDKDYITAAKELGLHTYCLSFVEQLSDLEEVYSLDPAARLYLKIESPKGLEFVRDYYPQLNNGERLIVARDDLFVNIGDDKTAMFDALKQCIAADPQAVVASRILTSVVKDTVPSMADLSDLWMLWHFGYRAFMLSDGLCQDVDAFLRAGQVLRKFFQRTQ